VARARGIAKVFCLSTQAINYFIARGYAQGKVEDLPPTRRDKWEQSGRKSQVLIKPLG